MTKPIETPSPSLPSLPSPRLLLHVATTRLASMVSIRSGSISHCPSKIISTSKDSIRSSEDSSGSRFLFEADEETRKLIHNVRMNLCFQCRFREKIQNTAHFFCLKPQPSYRYDQNPDPERRHGRCANRSEMANRGCGNGHLISAFQPALSSG